MLLNQRFSRESGSALNRTGGYTFGILYRRGQPLLCSDTFYVGRWLSFGSADDGGACVEVVLIGSVRWCQALVCALVLTGSIEVAIMMRTPRNQTRASFVRSKHNPHPETLHANSQPSRALVFSISLRVFLALCVDCCICRFSSSLGQKRRTRQRR